jgi:glycosyltransferase involved in cell wall biosynthesis
VEKLVRIAIASVQVPFINGGAEIHARSLQRELLSRGHEVEIVTIPFKWYPPQRIIDCMAMGRLLDLTAVNGHKIDKVIALKFPAYYLDHPDKVCWILHQHRQAYELFGTPFGDLHQNEEGRRVASEIMRWDNVLLPKSRKLFANSKTVAERLWNYNRIRAAPLYHPPSNYQSYRCDAFEDYVLYPGRFDSIKRQHLLVEAIAKAKMPIKVILIGSTAGTYGENLLRTIGRLDSDNRIECLGIVDQEKKVELYANALAVYNGVYQEDYGYVTLEAFFAGKPVITHSDSGGPLEFVRHRENGYVTGPDSQEIASVLDELYCDKGKAARMGEAGRELLEQMHIDWNTAIEQLLS